MFFDFLADLSTICQRMMLFMMDWHVLIEQFMDNNHNGIYTNRLLMGKMSLQIRPKMRAPTIDN